MSCGVINYEFFLQLRSIRQVLGSMVIALRLKVIIKQKHQLQVENTKWVTVHIINSTQGRLLF